MITNFFLKLMSVSVDWSIGFLPSVSSGDYGVFMGNITNAIGYLIKYFAIAMYVFPWYETLFNIMYFYILYHSAKFLVSFITWIASITPLSPVEHWDIR